jgi:hypothetical protein
MAMLDADIHDVIMLILNKTNYLHESDSVEALTKEVYKKYLQARETLLKEIENDIPKK